MPTNSITNTSPISSINPIEPPNQSVKSLPAQQFKNQINTYLAEGIKNNLSQDYVARQIETLAKENPDAASNSGLTDYQSIKKGVEQAYQVGQGNRPLALAGRSDADLFQWGVNIEADKRIQPKQMTEEDKQVIKNVGHDAIIGASIATGVASAPIALSVAKAAWQTLMGAAATPQGQQLGKDALDCLESIQDYSGPTWNETGVICGSLNLLNTVLTRMENDTN